MIEIKAIIGAFFVLNIGKERAGMPEQKQPYKICRAGGRSFPIYREYDEQLQESYPVYPDFEEHPAYTDDGKPFKTAEQESCPCRKPSVPGKLPPGDCGGCGWFYREKTPYDPIGTCMCGALRRKDNSDKRSEFR
jgi:hypothetical protein